MVAYTGKDTKIILNSGYVKYKLLLIIIINRKFHFKQSRADKVLNIVLCIHVLILFLLITIMGIAERVFSKEHITSSYIFYKITNLDLFAFKATLSYYLLFNQLIPLGLMIVIEISKIQ